MPIAHAGNERAGAKGGEIANVVLVRWDRHCGAKDLGGEGKRCRSMVLGWYGQAYVVLQKREIERSVRVLTG